MLINICNNISTIYICIFQAIKLRRSFLGEMPAWDLRKVSQLIVIAILLKIICDPTGSAFDESEILAKTCFYFSLKNLKLDFPTKIIGVFFHDHAATVCQMDEIDQCKRAALRHGICF